MMSPEPWRWSRSRCPNHYDPAAGRARLIFRFPPSRAGRQYSHTIRVASEREAERADAAIEETIQDLARGKLVLPADADADHVKAFIISGGKVTSPPIPPAAPAPPQPALTLGHLFDRYEADLTPGSKGVGTRVTERIHAGHFRRVLGEDRPLASLDLAAVQSYVDARGGAWDGSRSARS